MAAQAGTRSLNDNDVVIPVDGHNARIAREFPPLVLFDLPTAGFADIPVLVAWDLLNLKRRRDEPWT